MSKATFKSSSNFTVAAEWKTTLILSFKVSKSDALSPRPLAVMSPEITFSFCNDCGFCDFKMLNNWNEANKILSRYRKIAKYS